MLKKCFTLSVNDVSPLRGVDADPGSGVADGLTDASSRAVGEALERTHGADPTTALTELAHHFTLAAPLAGVERGVDYNLRAAEAATVAAA